MEVSIYGDSGLPIATFAIRLQSDFVSLLLFHAFARPRPFLPAGEGRLCGHEWAR